MHEVYTGVLSDNSIVWDGPAPPRLPVRVLVTTLDEEPVKQSDGAGMAAALRAIAKTGFGDTIPDPVAWQREIRQDRPLPGREE